MKKILLFVSIVFLVLFSNKTIAQTIDSVITSQYIECPNGQAIIDVDITQSNPVTNYTIVLLKLNNTATSYQFEQHIRAILNLPLGNTKSKIAAIMVNLVGEQGYIGDAYYKNLEQILSLEGVTPHIYGKKQTRPFRKMGHVTIVNNDISKARKIAELVKKTIKVINR